MYHFKLLIVLILFENVLAYRSERQVGDNVTDIIKDTEDRIINKNFNINDRSSISDDINTCGGIFSQSQFLIETPNYPGNYANNLNCLYIFKGPFCATNYTFQFLDFRLEQSLGCTADRLEIKHKDALCGTRDGIKTYSTNTGILELNFITNYETNARGFRILVSRSVCNSIGTNFDIPSSTTPSYPSSTIPSVDNFLPITPPNRFIPSQIPEEPAEDYPTPYPSSFRPNNPYLPPAPYPPANPYPQPSSERTCCAHSYNEKRFYLSSPGFPYSSNNPTECTYTIHRANPRVCRARLHFHFFWIGEQDTSCTKGYLQIDGKLICGCRTGMKLVTPFDGSFGNTKIFRFNNIGIPNSIFSGFAVEIIQDECPKRYTPDLNEPRHDHYYNDQNNRVAWPNLSQSDSLLRAQLINDNTEIFEPLELDIQPRVVKHVYFFDSPEYVDDSYDVSYTYNKRRNVEETTYIDTADLGPLYPNIGNHKCRMWGILQWTILNKDLLWQRMPKCETHPQTNPSIMSNCKEFSFVKGYFQSPGYPYYYPKNLNICYRFLKQNGYCKIRLIMMDFNVEESFDCKRDYLLLNGNFRYCGQSLSNTFTLFDMTGKNYEEVRFITDERNGGRGFRGVYEQIPCLGAEIPPIPNTTPLPFPPQIPSTTQQPPPTNNVPCVRTIREDYFTVDIYDYGKDMCNFVVIKESPRVCRLEISFVTFDFPCENEYLLINNQRFCGKLSGRTLTFNFDSDEIQIIYKRISYQPIGTGLKLHLVGRQIKNNCQDLEGIPPAQRISIESTTQISTTSIKNEISSKKYEIMENLDDVSVILKKQYKEVCGVIMNIKSAKLSESICNILLNNRRNVDCSPISNNTIYVPYNKSDKLELKFKNVETVEEIEFKQLTCDNKFVL